MAPGVMVEHAFEPLGEVTAQVIPPGRAVQYRLEGPYEKLGETWMALNAWASARGLEPAGIGWEIYGDPSVPVTDLYSMVK